MSVPGVSIIMPTFNARSFIDRALASVSAQTRDDLEIIIVDDCSTDDTYPYLETLAQQNPKIKLYRLPTNSGPSTARNMGIKHASGRWLCFLDADDAFEPGRLQEMTDTVEKYDLDFLADNLRLYDMHAGKSTGVAFNFGSGERVDLDLKELLRRDTIGSPRPLGWMKPMIKRSLIAGAQIGFPEDVRYGEDFLFFCSVLLLRPKAALLNRPLYIYTTRTGAISNQTSQNTRTVRSMQSFETNMQNFLNTNASKMDVTERKMFARRIEYAKSFEDYTNIRSDLDAKRYGRSLVGMLKSPIGTKILLDKLVAAVRRRYLNRGESV